MFKYFPYIFFVFHTYSGLYFGLYTKLNIILGHIHLRIWNSHFNLFDIINKSQVSSLVALFYHFTHFLGNLTYFQSKTYFELMFDRKVSSDYNILLSLRFILVNILSLSFTIPLSERRLRSASPPETPLSVLQCNAVSTWALDSLSQRVMSGVTPDSFSPSWITSWQSLFRWIPIS